MTVMVHSRNQRSHGLLYTVALFSMLRTGGDRMCVRDLEVEPILSSRSDGREHTCCPSMLECTWILGMDFWKFRVTELDG